MKKLYTLIIVLILFSHFSYSQHTFSIVAVDSVTGEIGSAGATCGDTITWPGTLGAMIISDIIPGTGAIHTQAYHNETNQENAHDLMVDGNSPQEIIDWLVDNDAQGAPSFRQYGIVDFNEGSPRSAGFTGSNCDDYKNHVLGPNYAIQGNILLGQEVLDSMENNFNETEGPLHAKLMAAMQGANMVGADTRCTSEGTSSLSSFLRVAEPDDDPDDLWLELWVGATDEGEEPIDVLQEMYDSFFATGFDNQKIRQVQPKVYPNPAHHTVTVEFSKAAPDRLVLVSADGQKVMEKEMSGLKNRITLNLENLNKGFYIIRSYIGNKIISNDKVFVTK